MSRVAILDGGSWGTGLAMLLSRPRESHQIAMWVHDAALATAMREKRENLNYVPEQKIPPQISVRAELREALAGAVIIVGAMPAAHAREICVAGLAHLQSGVGIVSATTGLERAKD